jgi:hypothetical protein
MLTIMKEVLHTAYKNIISASYFATAIYIILLVSLLQLLLLQVNYDMQCSHFTYIIYVYIYIYTIYIV